MKKIISYAVAIVTCVSTINAANLLQIDLNADGSSRVYDYFSNVYAEINLSPDGMYNITTDALQGGGAEVFANEGNWGNIGILTMSGSSTGSGIENFTITDATFDFNSYINGNLFTFLGGYTTALNITTGTVQLTNGVVTDLDLSGNIGFNFPAGGVTYDGTFVMDESSFTLDVDDTETPTGAPSLRYEWNATGTTVVEVVPEPSTFTLLALGLGSLAFMRRRRK